MVGVQACLSLRVGPYELDEISAGHVGFGLAAGEIVRHLVEFRSRRLTSKAEGIGQVAFTVPVESNPLELPQGRLNELGPVPPETQCNAFVLQFRAQPLPGNHPDAGALSRFQIGRTQLPTNRIADRQNSPSPHHVQDLERLHGVLILGLEETLGNRLSVRREQAQALAKRIQIGRTAPPLALILDRNPTERLFPKGLTIGHLGELLPRDARREVVERGARAGAKLIDGLTDRLYDFRGAVCQIEDEGGGGGRRFLGSHIEA